MKLSEHFSDTEFDGRQLGSVEDPVPPHKDLLDGLEFVRKTIGRPIMITSGYREPEHNKEVGGAKRSMHVTKPLRGVDITCPGVHPIDLAAVCLQWEPFRKGGLGLYPNDGHVHVDVRSDGPERWFA